MDPVDTLNISRSMVRITIFPRIGEPEYRAGIIIECDVNSVFIIADGREFENIGIDNITVYLHIKDGLYHKGFRFKNGLLGVHCTHPNGVFDMDIIKKIKLCYQPLKMSQPVYVYEYLSKTLTPGNITRFFGHQFSHNCAVVNKAEYGAPVINSNGEMVGMCCSFHYHLDAVRVSAIAGTIEYSCGYIQALLQYRRDQG